VTQYNTKHALTDQHQLLMAVAWLSGNVVGNINKVTPRRAGSVLGWVTTAVFVFIQGTQANSAWSSLLG